MSSTEPPKVISLREAKKAKILKEKRQSPDTLVKLNAELEYRTGLIASEMDKLDERLERVEALLNLIIKSFKKD